MNPDGSDQKNLTQHRANDYAPVWSPTGRQILFVSDRGGIPDLYLMDADGTNVRQVFKKLRGREFPTWSPDGKAHRLSPISHILLSTPPQLTEKMRKNLPKVYGPPGRPMVLK